MNKLLSILYCAVNLCFIINPIFGFNVDLPSAIEFNGDPKSMFGFSIALHQYHSNKSIIVGAPKKDLSRFQQNVIEGGAVYQCKLFDAEPACKVIHFDAQGNTFDKGDQIDTKSYQWFGATVATGGDNGPIIACAPRYVFHTIEPKKQERIEPVGTCFTSSGDLKTFTQFSPCRTNNYGYHRQGSCQAGFSAAISKSNDRLFIGAPGSWYWQGQVFSIHPQSRFPYQPPNQDEFGSRGQAYSYDVTDPRNPVYATGESHPSDDDSYLGYSMVTGHLNGNKNDPEDIAIGMPRGANLTGQVVILSWDILNPINISGLQLGEYFGYSLCVVDVNGDGLDDLIIGAPMHAEEDNENKYDVGRVYIMLQTKSRLPFSKYMYRDGLNSRGRFGLALTTLGDINQDGYGDFAVGAPYDGPDERGAVYIYHGSKEGPFAKPSQIIQAEDVSFKQKLKTFGFSLAGGMDLDNNQYPDFAVGAYGTDAVIILRSRPVANVVASTKYQVDSKVINLEEKTCTLTNGARVSCVNYISCIKYNGLNVPSPLAFTLSWILDAKKIKHPRMYFLKSEGRNQKSSKITLHKDENLCFVDQVYIKNNAGDIQDKLTPLEIEMTYEPIQSGINDRFKRQLEPVIDKNKETVQRDSINILKNCGADDVCIPDLKLKTIFPENFIIGSKLPFEIDISVPNNGEDSFETAFYMTVPEGLNYKNIKQPEDSRDITITCSETNSVLKCNLGNPLPANRNANFKVILAPSQKQPDFSSQFIQFNMVVNSTNPELEGSNMDNLATIKVEKTVDAELAIYGASQPESEIYKPSDYKNLVNATKEADVGPSVVHIYSIRNNGPAAFNEAVVQIHWPYKTNGGDDLMYLMSEPETLGNIKCERSLNLNPRKLETEKNSSSLKHWLKARVAVVDDATNENSIHVTKTISTGTSAVSSKTLTEAEKKALAANELEPSHGDSSMDREQRANAASLKLHTENSTQFNIPSGSYNNVRYNNEINRHHAPPQHIQNNGPPRPATQNQQSIYHSVQPNKQNEFRTSSVELLTDIPNSQPDPYNNFPQNRPTYTPRPQYLSYPNNDQDNFLYEDPMRYHFHNPNQHHHQSRPKRDAIEPLCQRVQCVTINCVIKNLNVNDEVYIAMRMRLIVESLEKLSENAPINMSTMAVAKITEYPYIGPPKKPKFQTHEINYQAIPESSLDTGIIPLWAVILSAIIGAIILLLLIFLLYKCGFFKRNRPSSNAQERQPLNRNGYHGDEHL